jgi:hypothetical protein
MCPLLVPRPGLATHSEGTCPNFLEVLKKYFAGPLEFLWANYVLEPSIIIINYWIIIIIIIIILGISFMQGIYTYIPEKNHVPREHCVATILM